MLKILIETKSIKLAYSYKLLIDKQLLKRNIHFIDENNKPYTIPKEDIIKGKYKVKEDKLRLLNYDLSDPDIDMIYLFDLDNNNLKLYNKILSNDDLNTNYEVLSSDEILYSNDNEFKFILKKTFNK